MRNPNSSAYNASYFKYVVSLMVFWRLTPKKDIVCSSVLVLQCCRVPLIPPPPPLPALTRHSSGTTAEKETKGGWGGAEKIKSGGARGRGYSRFTERPSLTCFSPFQGVFPCVFRQPI